MAIRALGELYVVQKAWRHKAFENGENKLPT
jgi:hypothetical protein